MDDKHLLRRVAQTFLYAGAAITAVLLLIKTAGPAAFGWLLNVGDNVGLPGTAGAAAAGGAGQCPPGTRTEDLPPGIPWPNSGGLGCPRDPDTGRIMHDHPETTPGGPICVPDQPYHSDPDGGWDGYYGDKVPASQYDPPPSGSPPPHQTFSEWFDNKAKEVIDQKMDHREYR